MLLLGVVFKEVVGDKFNGELGTFLGALAHGGQQDGHHGLVEVGAHGQVLVGAEVGGLVVFWKRIQII